MENRVLLDINQKFGKSGNSSRLQAFTLDAAPEIKVFGDVLDKFFDGHRDKRTLELVQMSKY